MAIFGSELSPGQKLTTYRRNARMDIRREVDEIRNMPVDLQIELLWFMFLTIVHQLDEL